MSVGGDVLVVEREDNIMNSWAELGLGELDDLQYGVTKDWIPFNTGPGFSKTLATQHFVVNAIAMAKPGFGFTGPTVINFDVDEVLPDMLAAQDYVKEKGHPSRSQDADTYKVWSRALTEQGRRFKAIIAQVKAESPELAQLLGDWGGTAYAHGKGRPMPVIRGVTLRVPIQPIQQEIVMAQVLVVSIRKRDTYTEELAHERLAGNAG